MDKLKMQTPDLTDKNIEQIAHLFPNVITEIKGEDGTVKKAVDFDLLKQVLSNSLVGDDNERYRLDWAGKKASLLKANTPITKTLRPCRKESVNFDTTENLYIEGDNFEVLKILQESYLGKVKMIYIDPPYNTGSDFIYKDNFVVSKEDYDEELGTTDEEGGKLFRNTDSNGRFHSDWLSMMYERLVVARDLLSDDGVIFISIDDNEVHNVSKICGEIFGEENILSMVVVNRTSEIASGNNISKHEYILAYAKNLANVSVDGVEKYTISRGTVGNANQTMPIIEFPAGLNCYNLKDGEYAETRKVVGGSENIENLDPIIVKNGKLNKAVRLKAKWRSSNDMRNFFDNDCQPTVAKINGIIEEIYFENDKFNPQIKKKTFEKISSLFLENKRGSEDLKELDLNYFDYPKSVVFLRNIIEKFKFENEIVLDFFAGSATTAQAVMQLNAEDGCNRRFIMVQISEQTAEDSEAYKAGYKTIAEFGKERIRRAGKKAEELKASKQQLELGEAQVDPSKLDIGFRVYKTDDTNMKDVFYHPAELNQKELSDLVSNIKDDRTPEDLLTQVILDLGLELSLPIQIKKILGNTIYIVQTNALVACFDAEIDFKIVDAISDLKPLKVVFKDASFKDDKDRINVEERFKRLSPETKVAVI